MVLTRNGVLSEHSHTVNLMYYVISVWVAFHNLLQNCGPTSKRCWVLVRLL